jgi:hypothetical protein
VVQNCDRSKEQQKSQSNRMTSTVFNERKAPFSQPASVVPNAVKSAHDDVSTSETVVSSAKGKGACFICHSMDHKKFQCPQLKVKQNSAE